MKAIIVLYDDLVELDRTEVTYQGEEQLRTIVASTLQDTPSAELAEVYNNISKRLMKTYRLTRTGKLVDCNKEPVKPKTWRNRPRKPPEEKMSHQIYLNVTKEVSDFLLEKLGKTRNSFIREAIQEKFEREGIEKQVAKPKPEHPDRRYHRMFAKLPSTIKVYDGRDLYRRNLTIVKNDDNWHVSYGEYTTQEGAPSVEHQDLLSALEYMKLWIDDNKSKWIVGKVIK